MTKKTYEAEYTCRNCKEKEIFNVEFGSSMPTFMHPLPEDEFTRQFYRESPECAYCGCRDWSDGKKPSYA